MADTALVTDFLVGKDQTTMRMNDLIKRTEDLGRLSARGFITTDKARNEVNKLKTQFGELGGAINDTFKRGTAAAGQFDMRMLSIMFGGMALMRVFGGVLRSIKDTFLKAEGDTSALTESTTQLNAAWEFFKFSLFDALNTPFFLRILDGIKGTIDSFSQMKDGVKIALVSVIGSLAALGTGLFILGQVRLGWDSMLGKGGFFTTTSSMNDKGFGTSGVFTKLRNLATAGLVIKTVFDIDTLLESDADMRTILDKLGTDISLIGLVSGKKWIIAAGLTLKLLPSGERIKDTGRDLINAAREDFTKAGELRDIPRREQTGKTILEETMKTWMIGPLKLVGGTLTMGAGQALSWGMQIAESKEESENFGKTLNTNTIPAVDGLNNSLTNISEVTTPIFINSTAERIIIIDTETDAINNQNDALKENKELKGISEEEFKGEFAKLTSSVTIS